MIHISRLYFYVMVVHSTLVIKIQILHILNHYSPTPRPAPPALHSTPFYYPVPLHPPLVNLLLQPAPYPLPTFYTLYTPHPQTVLPLYPVLIICTSHPPPPTSQSLCVPPYPLNFSSSHQPIRVELFSNYQRERGRGKKWRLGVKFVQRKCYTSLWNYLCFMIADSKRFFYNDSSFNKHERFIALIYMHSCVDFHLTPSHNVWHYF